MFLQYCLSADYSIPLSLVNLVYRFHIAGIRCSFCFAFSSPEYLVQLRNAECIVCLNGVTSFSERQEDQSTKNIMGSDPTPTGNGPK